MSGRTVLTLDDGSSLTIATEIAFGSNPGAATYTWTDVSSYVRQIEYERGRLQVLNKVQAGAASLTLYNLDRRFEPLYTASPYYPNVIPLTPIRVVATIGATNYPLFLHFIERWPEKRIGPSYATQNLTTVDGFEMLSQRTLPGASYPEELSGARVSRILDAAGWPSGLRSISTGQSTIQSLDFADTDQLVALTQIQDVETAEAGMFFIDGRGYAVFLDRDTLQNSPYSASQATLSDRASDVPADADLFYSDSSPAYDKDLIYNDWQVSPTSNGAYPSLVEQEAIDSSSETSYFTRVKPITVPLTTDNDMLSLAQYMVYSYRQPLERHDLISIRPGLAAAAWQQILTRELADRITILEHPPGGGAANSTEERIQHLKMTIPTAAADTTCEWSTYPASVGSVLIHDDATAGAMDSVYAHGY